MQGCERGRGCRASGELQRVRCRREREWGGRCMVNCPIKCHLMALEQGALLNSPQRVLNCQQLCGQEWRAGRREVRVGVSAQGSGCGNRGKA